MSFNNLSFFIILFVLISCSGGDKSEINNCKRNISYSFIKTGYKKEFVLPKNILCYASKLQVSFPENSNEELEQLYFLGRENILLTYDIKEEKLINQIVLKERGPDGIGRANGFYVISNDSILITSKYRQIINIVNNNGNKIFSFNFRNDSLKTSSTTSDFYCPVFKENENLFYINQKIEGNWNSLSVDDFKSYKTTLAINIKTGDMRKTGMGIPYSASDLKRKSFNYSATKTNNKYIFSFNGSDSIFTSKNLKNWKGFFCKSSHMPNDLAEYLGTDDVREIMHNKIRSSRYSTLTWDPYRRLIYRFYILGQEIKPTDNVFDLYHYPSHFGIMVINENMEIIADEVFEKNKYFFNNHFVTNEGLYISINHPFNPQMDLNKLTFELIKLEPK